MDTEHNFPNACTAHAVSVNLTGALYGSQKTENCSRVEAVQNRDCAKMVFSYFSCTKPSHCDSTAAPKGPLGDHHEWVPAPLLMEARAHAGLREGRNFPYLPSTHSQGSARKLRARIQDLSLVPMVSIFFTDKTSCSPPHLKTPEKTLIWENELTPFPNPALSTTFSVNITGVEKISWVIEFEVIIETTSQNLFHKITKHSLIISKIVCHHHSSEDTFPEPPTWDNWKFTSIF